MNDEQIDRLLSAAESIADSLCRIAGQPTQKEKDERARWDEELEGEPYRPYDPDDRTYDPMTIAEAMAALDIKSDKTLKARCAEIGIGVENLTVGLVEYFKRKKVERHKRRDVADRNKKNSHPKYDGKVGCKER